MSVKLRRRLLAGLLAAAFLLVVVPIGLNYQRAWDPDEHLNVGIGEPFEVEQARDYWVSVASPAQMTNSLNNYLVLVAAPGDEQPRPNEIELNLVGEDNAWVFGLYADRRLEFKFRGSDGLPSNEANLPVTFNEGASVADLRFEIARREAFSASRAFRTMRWAVVPLVLALLLAVATRRTTKA